MEAASIPEQQPEPEAARRRRRSPGSFIWDNLLPILLGVALLYFLVHDFNRTFDDLKTGLSNGTVWALIALGYTLVYGIIELINFAHGEVFMIGSFVSVSIWQLLGLSDTTAAESTVRPSVMMNDAEMNEPIMKTSPWAKLINSTMP